MSNKKLTKEQLEIIEDNIGLIYKASNDYKKVNKARLKSKHIEDEDITQMGFEGVYKHISKYNENRGIISTYIYKTAYFEISEQVNSFNQIKIPPKKHWGCKCHKDYEFELNSIGINGVMSQNEIIQDNEGNETEIGSLIEDGKNVYDDLLFDLELNDILTEKEKRIIGLSMCGYTQREMQKIFNVANSTMNIWFNKAKSKLKLAYGDMI